MAVTWLIREIEFMTHPAQAHNLVKAWFEENGRVECKGQDRAMLLSNIQVFVPTFTEINLKYLLQKHGGIRAPWKTNLAYDPKKIGQPTGQSPEETKKRSAIYNQSEKGKAAQKAAQAKYKQSEKGKAIIKAAQKAARTAKRMQTQPRTARSLRAWASHTNSSLLQLSRKHPSSS